MNRALRIVTNERLLVAAMAVTVLFVSWRYSTMVAGGSDSYGYISQADGWRHGRVVVPQPWMARVPWPARR